MKSGQITEKGNHEELMKQKNGEYSHLIHTFHNSEDGLFIGISRSL